MRDFWAFLRTYVVAEVLIILAAAIFLLDQIGRLQALSGLPHWFLQLASVLIFLGAVISILYHQHRRIESFKPAPPPPAADTATTALANLLAQLVYVRDTRQGFDARVAKGETKWTLLLETVKTVKPETPPSPAAPWKRTYNAWLAEVRAAQKFALDTMGFKRDFLESINFQKNPGVTVPDEQNFGTEADKYDLRRAYDEHRSCTNAVEAFRATLNAKETMRKTIINTAAKPSVEDKA